MNQPDALLTADKGRRFTTLAIDTAGEILSLGLASAGGRWFFEADAGLRHSELLMDSIRMLMNRAGVKPEELSGILCMGGPGSFTGLRIAFATAKGLALALGIPFAPIPSLDCMALAHAAWPGLTVPVIDAKRKAFFCALYRSGRRISDYMDAEPDRIIETVKAAAGKGEKALLTGIDAEKLIPIVPDGLFCADQRLRRGYAPELLGIAKNGEIFNTYSTDWLSGPQYIRSEPVTSETKVNSNKS